MTFDFDLFIIGAGSGGVRAARIAASHGAKVAVAEEYRIGGTCVIRGCVPKKMLVYGAHFAEDLHEAERFGWDIEGASFNWKRLRNIVQDDVTRLEGLYTNTLNSNHATIFAERATVAGPHTVRLASGKEVSAKYILIAVGAWPSIPDVPGAEHGITSNEVFHLDALPKRVVIAGAGYIANEFAGVFHAFGSKVSLITRGDRMLRSYDTEIVDRLVAMTTAKGIDVHFNFPCFAITKQADGSLLLDGGEKGTIETDMLVFAIGRTPKTPGLGLETVGVETDKNGAILVDKYNRTNVESIYAVGDVTDHVQLTPVAIREGHAFADTVFGNTPRTVDYRCIPTAVFSSPPIAGVGLTEDQARAEFGESVKLYRSDFRPMKNVVSGRMERGLYKMITVGADERVVGLHLIGPDSAEILQAAAIAVKAGLTKQAFDDTVALHPSMAEELVLLK
ncbi:glutathione-disulfide reductase [Chakrabartia godavariana]|nr:glutathione-disulfide reductase [Chakrabartia godavariana]